MKRLLSILIILPGLAQASLFQKIYKGYKQSERLEEVQLGQKFTELDFIIGKELYDWQLGLSSEYQDSFLQALFAFQGRKTITQNYGVNLSKPSYRYGTFSIGSVVTTYDLSNWESSNLDTFTADKVFETRNTISYEYEFLNNSLNRDWEIVHLQNLANRTSDKLASDKDHYDFFSAYLDAKHKIILDRLYKDFELRAKSRVSQISSRVRDGLSRGVDLDQAKLSLYSQQETIINNKSELRLSVAAIEDIINMPITKKEYDLVTWNFKPAEKAYPYIMSAKGYVELENLKAQNEIAEKNIAKANEADGHSLTLSMSYAKNAFSEDINESISEAASSSERDQKIVALNYTIPLGVSKRDARKEKLALARNRSLLKIKNRTGELEVRHKVLIENIKRFEKAINITDKKINVAQRVVKENKRLYLRGQISFEESLRAEESLINARITQANMLLAHESALAELAYLVGEINPYLRDYKD